MSCWIGRLLFVKMSWRRWIYLIKMKTRLMRKVMKWTISISSSTINLIKLLLSRGCGDNWSTDNWSTDHWSTMTIRQQYNETTIGRPTIDRLRQMIDRAIETDNWWTVITHRHWRSHFWLLLRILILDPTVWLYGARPANTYIPPSLPWIRLQVLPTITSLLVRWWSTTLATLAGIGGQYLNAWSKGRRGWDTGVGRSSSI